MQYVLDLKVPRFSDAIIRRFLGHVYELSLQKFSSNVIEKVRGATRWPPRAVCPRRTHRPKEKKRAH